MDKIILIRKEIKDCKLYLNELYEALKKETSKRKQKQLIIEINGVSNTKNILSNLILDYENGIGDTKLEEITIKNNENFKKYQSINRNTLKNDLENFWKIRHLKSSLDIINEKYLSKQEIYEYLNNYNEVMKLARENIHTSIEGIFYAYMDSTNQSHKANLDYYQKMIKIHILFVNTSILSIIKDEEFEHLWATDEEMSEKIKGGSLSFLKDKFIIPTDSPRFKKTHIFNYIRNAFFHSDNNELYRISPDCNYINISLKQTNPIPFNVKITANDIFRMSKIIKEYAHHVTAFELENQDKLIVEDLFDHYHKCSRELNKVSLVRKILPSNISKRKEDINKDLIDPKVIFSSKLFNQTLSEYGEVEDLKYKLSNQQKRLLHQKFKHFNKCFGNIDMKYFVVPIIINYMPNGINKINFLNFDSAVSYTYLFNYEYSIYDIMNDIVNDYMLLGNNKTLPQNKRTVFNYIHKNIDISKHELLYLFDNNERENYNDILLFKYVYGTINNEEEINIGGINYPTERIRNALTHNRWRGFTNERGKRCFYLYDDEDSLVDPDTINPSKTFWNATFLYDDLKRSIDEIMENYYSNIKVKLINNEKVKKLTKE